MVALRLSGLAKVSNPEHSILRNPLIRLSIFFLVLVGGILYLFRICIHAQERYLKRILYGMQGQFARPIPFLQQLLRSRGAYQFSGKCMQRSVIITYLYRWRRLWEIQTGPAPEERLDIQFPLIQKFWLRMILDPGHQDRKDEVILNHSVLDHLYVIHSNQPEVAREFLTNQAGLQDLQRLPHPFNRLEIHKGLGRVEFHLPARKKFDRVHLEIAVESLARLFTDYETRSKFLIVVAPSQDARCPYCREILVEGGAQIVQCAQCNSRIHFACWNENKQCTTWGCQSRSLANVGTL